MIFNKPPLASLLNESDVEQKFVYLLLTGELPFGLGHDVADVHTKRNIRKFSIGKGVDQKSYFPDYIISRYGVPFIAIEGKEPGSDLIAAFREARLYASELNAIYPTGVNPLQKIIATDGARLVAGPPDQAAPVHDLTYDQIDQYSDAFSRLQEEYSAAALDADYARLRPRLRPQRFWKPRRMVGGAAIQQEEVGLNSFGATISADFAHIFNPVSREDRATIAREAYIPSKRRERYVEPIDRVIRAATPPSETKSRTIEDTASPDEIIKAFRGARPLEHQVLLIVGSAGAGKTTFVDHLQEVALPRDVRERTVWVRIDMNPAPISRAEIYDWLRKEIIRGLKLAHPKIDFDDLDTIKAINAVELNQFRKGVGRLYEGQPAIYNAKMAEHLTAVTSDLHATAMNYSRYLTSERGKLLVLALDNSDKRLRDEQLLMFEAAQWLQKEFRGLVVLPLREETYDNHRNEPPLDTALKDLVFRIEPPLFQKILFSRVNLAMKSIEAGGKKTLKYTLPNGFQVEYPATEQAFYLSSIMRSIFEHDLHIRRLIVGLAGRNMRRALEIFLEFCTSGHITEDHILKMRQSQGQYVLPLSLVTTVLLRLNQRFYDSSRAYLKNIYFADERDQRPHFFVRLLILRWLSERFSNHGPTRLKGYFPIGEMRSDLSRYGVDEIAFTREIEALAKAFCILSEDFRTTNLSDQDLVSLSPAGVVHLQMANDVYYLAAIAEDTWFDQKEVAEGIADRIKHASRHYQPRTALYNASDLVAMLSRVRGIDIAAIGAAFDASDFERLTEMGNAERSVEQFERSIVPAPWVGVPKRFPLGSRHQGRIANIRGFGIFVDLEPGVTGLIHSSRLPSHFETSGAFVIGDSLSVQITDLDHVRARLGLGL